MRNVLISTAAFAAMLAVGCGSTSKQATKTTTSEGQSSTAPAGSQAANRDRALVRMVNADPNRTSLDLWFGDAKAFTDVSYKTVTPYMELPSERFRFKLRRSGEMNDLATNSEGLWKGRHYTVVAARKKDGSATLNVINDDESAPSAGKAKVRMINEAPDAGELNLAATGRKDAIFDGVNFNSSTRYKEIEPVTGDLVVREEKKGPAVEVPDTRLQPDKLYTIIVTGEKGKIETIRIEDQLTGPQTAMR